MNKNNMLKIAEELGKELSFHTLKEKKYEVDYYQCSCDPFALSNNALMVIREAEKDLKYLGCYMACMQDDMKYMYRGIYQGNRLDIAKAACLACDADHGRFFVQAVLAFSCNDYDIVGKILPVSAGFSTNSYFREMTNLLMAIFYKDENMKNRAVAESRQYLQKKRKKYEQLICNYFISLLERDAQSAGTYLQEICKCIGRATMIQNECSSNIGVNHLSENICLFGHGLCSIASYYLGDDEYAAMALPETKAFITEYEIYRRQHENLKPEVLISFSGENDFVNMVPVLMPDIFVRKPENYVDTERFHQELFQKLYGQHLLRTVEEATDIAWISKWSGWNQFQKYYRAGDERKLFYNRGLIYYAVSNPNPADRYKISSFLLDRQCMIDPVKKEWDGPFHYLFRQKKQNAGQTVELCKKLLKNGADPNLAGKNNYLPVSCLMMLDVPEEDLLPLIEFWLSLENLDFSLRSFSGLLPYDLAVKYGKRQAAKLLQPGLVKKTEQETCKVVLEKVPEDKLKTLSRIKRVFELDLSTKELLAGANNLPFILAEDYLKQKAEEIISQEKLDEFVSIL